MDESNFEERFRRGVGLINEKEFFEAHDVLEELWNEERGEMRLFLQGMIQAAVGCYHLSNGNTTGAMSQYQKSLDKLTKYDDHYLGIDLKSFRTGLARCYEGALMMASKQATYEVAPEYFPEVAFVEEVN